MWWAENVVRTGAEDRRIEILVGKLQEKRHLEDPRVDGRIIRKRDFSTQNGAWTGVICLTIWTSDGVLWTRLWNFEFHKMQGIYWLAEEQSASQDGLCSMEYKVYSNTVHDTHAVTGHNMQP